MTNNQRNTTPEEQMAAVTAPLTREGVIQHLTNAGVLEHDGCGIFIASGDASELIDACMALAANQLAPDHDGLRIQYGGLMFHVGNALRQGHKEPPLAHAIGQLCQHLKELGKRYYAGDLKVVDEFLQLYCIEEEARAQLALTRTPKEPTP